MRYNELGKKREKEKEEKVKEKREDVRRKGEKKNYINDNDQDWNEKSRRGFHVLSRNLRWKLSSSFVHFTLMSLRKAWIPSNSVMDE